MHVHGGVNPALRLDHPRRHNADGGLVVSGTIGDVLVAQYRVDLAADDLDAEMVAMAQSLEALIAATG